MFGKMNEANKDLAQFYERLMLLALGSIGLSVSALISFVSRFPLNGIHKVIVVSLASTSWIFLFISAMYCRSVISDCMASNRHLLNKWMTELSDGHASAIGFHMQRMGTVFTGTAVVGGEIYDPKEVLAEGAKELVALFDTKEKARLKKVIEETKFDTKDTSRRARVAVLLLHWALLLLAITSVVVFAGM
jgi:hypothetical protein